MHPFSQEHLEEQAYKINGSIMTATFKTPFSELRNTNMVILLQESSCPLSMHCMAGVVLKQQVLFIHLMLQRILNNIYCYYPFHKGEHQDTESLSNLTHAS